MKLPVIVTAIIVAIAPARATDPVNTGMADPAALVTSNGRNADPPERLGWGNDGAPLRDFSIVAIAQHATRTLSRRPGIDFRVPADEELDALVAYQLPLGRQEDFNLQTLELKSVLARVESADTGPFFHNHTVKTLEEAVAFYGTPAFQTAPFSIGSPGGPVPVKISPDPNDPEVQAISAFLRLLNALENTRSSINVAERGRRMQKQEDARELAKLALAETIDAFEVLSQGALARSHEASILSARAHLFAARLALEIGQRLSSLALIEEALEQACRVKSNSQQ
jgi:hypothetical protein